MNRHVPHEPQLVFEAIAKELCARVRPRADDRVLDVACGSWVVGREIQRQGVRFVAGIDVALGRLRAGGSSTSCLARAESLPFGDDAFTLVTCQHGLMFFDDRAASLREAARVLRAGGRYAATCWCALEENPGFAALHEAIAADLGPAAAECAARPFSLPDPETVAGELAGAGFSNVAVDRFEPHLAARSLEELATWYLRRTSLAPFVEGRDAAFASIRARVARALAAHQAPNGVVLPGAAYCVQAELG